MMKISFVVILLKNRVELLDVDLIRITRCKHCISILGLTWLPCLKNLKSIDRSINQSISLA